MPHMKKVLDGFRHRVSHNLTGRQPRKGKYVGWVYPPLEDTMEEAGLRDVETYVSGRQNTLAQYIVTKNMMYLYLEAKQRPVPRV